MLQTLSDLGNEYDSSGIYYRHYEDILQYGYQILTSIYKIQSVDLKEITFYLPDETDIKQLDTSINLKIDYIKHQCHSELDYFLEVVMEKIKNMSESEHVLFITISMDMIISGHANLLVYRKSTNSLEHFDPFPYDGDNISIFLEDILWYIVNEMNIKNKQNNDIYYKGEIKFISQIEIYPSSEWGFQSIEENFYNKSDEMVEKEGIGFCILWCIFFAELVLLNPNLTSKEIIIQSVQFVKKQTNSVSVNKEMGLYFRNIIRGYLVILYVNLNIILNNLDPPISIGNFLSIETMYNKWEIYTENRDYLIGIHNDINSDISKKLSDNDIIKKLF
jgi:hypothetical protein